MERRKLLILVVIGSMIAFGLPALPAAADNVTAQCNLGQHPEETQVGDGPWVGDAPDDRSILTVPSCWNGQLADEDDLDSFHLGPDHPEVNWVLEIGVASGCVEYDVDFTGPYDPFAPGDPGVARRCAGWSQTFFIHGTAAELTFSDGTGTYWFWY